MFLSPFDPGYDFEPPTGSALLAEIGVDRHTVREVAEDDRSLRCPDRDTVHPDHSLAVLDDRTPFEQALHEAALLDLPGPSPACRSVRRS